MNEEADVRRFQDAYALRQLIMTTKHCIYSCQSGDAQQTKEQNYISERRLIIMSESVQEIGSTILIGLKICRVKLFRTKIFYFTACLSITVLVWRGLLHTAGINQDNTKDFPRKEDGDDSKVFLPEQQISSTILQTAQQGKTKGPIRTAVIITTKRSGSTLLGEFFNQNRRCFYLFEPLFPFTRYCNALRQERTALLDKLSRCDFFSVPKEYAKAFVTTKHTDERAKCQAHNMCFSNRNMNVLHRYAAACKKPDKMTNFEKVDRFIPESPCGYPLNVTLLSSLCSAADIVAYKVIRICNMEDMDSIFNGRSPNAPRLGVLHLVRDPRAVLSSRLLLESDELVPSTLDDEAKRLCKKMTINLDYAERALMNPDHSSNRARYLRVRYEDLTLQPLANAYEIYSFLERELPMSVKLWITNSFFSEKKRSKASGDPYSTVKDGRESLNAWRTKLAMEQVHLIQKYCSTVMDRLGYRTLNKLEELQDWNVTFW